MFLIRPFMENMDSDEHGESYDPHFDSLEGLIVNGVRSRKKIAELPGCPVCSCTMRSHELQAHFALEIEKLNKITSPGGTKRKSISSTNQTVSQAGSSTSTAATAADQEVDVTGCTGGDTYKKMPRKQTLAPREDPQLPWTINRQLSISEGRPSTSPRPTSSPMMAFPVALSLGGSMRIVTDDSSQVRNVIRTPGGNLGLAGIDRDLLQKIRLNRLLRLRKTRRSLNGRGDGPSHSSMGGGMPIGSCPICRSFYPLRKLQRHVLRCLRETGNGDNDDSLSDIGDTSSDEGTIDVEGDGGTVTVENGTSADTNGDVDEDVDKRMISYTWAGQERIRATALQALEGSILLTASSPTQHEDVLQTLVVDGDEDEELYGPPQFSPSLLGGEGGWEGGPWEGGGAGRESPPRALSPPPAPPAPPAPALSAAVEALTQRLKEIEDPRADRVKCHICLSAYTDPVVSIQCWHVHCEVCWLSALRAKKTCPQCMAITTTTHLRRIYI